MTNFKKTTSRVSHYNGNTLQFRSFWVMVLMLTAFLVVYIYSIYQTVDLSFRIEKEMRIIKNENALYQQVAESYVKKLETLQEEGSQTLGLTSPEKQFFIDRYDAVARAGI